MSKGQKNQRKHVHVNKYAAFSKAAGALDRIISQQEQEQTRKEKENKEITRTIMGGGSGIGRMKPEIRQYYYTPNLHDSLTSGYSRNYMPSII